MESVMKFKAFNKITKQIIDIAGFDLYNGNIFTFEHDEEHGVISKNIKDYEILQYRGIKDKNNKEIYGGYVLKSSLGGKQIVEDIRYTFVTNTACYNSEEYLSRGRSEIIGNIYENPELLKYKD